MTDSIKILEDSINLGADCGIIDNHESGCS